LGWNSVFVESGSLGSELQDARIDAVCRHLLARGVESVIDLGCGNGDLLVRLAAEPRLKRIVGLDLSCSELLHAQSRLQLASFSDDGRIELVHGSFTARNDALTGFDAATLIETIEHIDAFHLPAIEDAVFGCFRPRHVIVTTPNQEYNVVYGLGSGEFRHPDHRFEWGRLKFRQWTRGIASRHGYELLVLDIGEPHPELGCPTQMAVFSIKAA
jgi:small RNA 2'-O-methyltransferase